MNPPLAMNCLAEEVGEMADDEPGTDIMSLLGTGQKLGSSSSDAAFDAPAEGKPAADCRGKDMRALQSERCSSKLAKLEASKLEGHVAGPMQAFLSTPPLARISRGVLSALSGCAV